MRTCPSLVLVLLASSLTLWGCGSEDNNGNGGGGNSCPTRASLGLVTGASVEMDFSSATVEVSVRHALDDGTAPAEGEAEAEAEAAAQAGTGCLTEITVVGTLNEDGCQLALQFGIDDQQQLVLYAATLQADAFCAGLPVEEHGLYELASSTDVSVELPVRVQDGAAASESLACATLTLGGSVQLVLAERSLDVSLDGWTVDGVFESSADPEAVCVGEPGGDPRLRGRATLIPEVSPFQIAFYYPRDESGTQVAADLYITQQAVTPDNLVAWKERRPGTDNLANLTEGAIECGSCALSPDGRQLLWAETDPASGQYELFVAPIEPGWRINLTLKRRVAGGDPTLGRLDTQGRQALGFAGEWVVYGLTHGATKQVWSEQALDGSGRHMLHELVNGGGFIVSPAGLVVTMYLNSLSSMTLYSTQVSGEATNLQMHTFEVEGGGTGSDYRGTEKGAISPDGQFLALLTEARPATGQQGELLLHIIRTEPAESGFGHVAQYKLGPAGQGACNVPRQPGEFVTSDHPPLWAPDGRYVYVLGKSGAGCRNNYAVADTDILRIEVLDNGELAGMTNITQNRLDWDHPTRVEVHEMQLSPDGRALILAATPYDRVRRRDIFVMSSRANEVYDDLLAEKPNESFFKVMIRLTGSARHEVRFPYIFPVR